MTRAKYKVGDKLLHTPIISKEKKSIITIEQIYFDSYLIDTWPLTILSTNFHTWDLKIATPLEIALYSRKENV